MNVVWFRSIWYCIYLVCVKPGDHRWLISERRFSNFSAYTRPKDAHSAQVFGDARLQNGLLAVSSTKGATGHLLGAAGAVEAAFTALALHFGSCCPGTNLHLPDDLDMAGLLKHKARQFLPPHAVGICNSFGFGGVNACLVLSQCCGK
jgi:3-oxoacyl-(acyl-carrier-protein) synthase